MAVNTAIPAPLMKLCSFRVFMFFVVFLILVNLFLSTGLSPKSILAGLLVVVVLAPFLWGIKHLCKRNLGAWTILLTDAIVLVLIFALVESLHTFAFEMLGGEKKSIANAKK